MNVIKKNGRIQNFDESKIKVSILNASSSGSSLLNESDIKIIVEDVTKLLEKLRGSEQNTSSYEIMGAIINILKRDGFDEVISSYIGYKKE
ncbi:ATP cone domain-containing protein [Clostridium celatum]|uniref:ATP-cone domain-containing protein n=1 Tax=Clostridium celatum DSM 1785 TaxID=545697 RepID=L1Q3A3_9CLOT|nr:ATP cone domain-containing protein [Clostridium celatum]EKY22484.1 hypothetical protein HMPREF0216_03207 [Clostridium celatum DSM 1785]MCE9656182.1 hypothetical protein [Clostridium celatum]MDU2264882.1 ATP cone domain-containing protein [Clostridium celatum]MDU3724790.1 ATP cone domain-containing protein [Clostridium celatum]MDU6294476.1 ATP cone domain-containing protein [Clostridium celatum]